MRTIETGDAVYLREYSGCIDQTVSDTPAMVLEITEPEADELRTFGDEMVHVVRTCHGKKTRVTQQSLSPMRALDVLCYEWRWKP